MILYFLYIADNKTPEALLLPVGGGAVGCFSWSQGVILAFEAGYILVPTCPISSWP